VSTMKMSTPLPAEVRMEEVERGGARRKVSDGDCQRTRENATLLTGVEHENAVGSNPLIDSVKAPIFRIILHYFGLNFGFFFSHAVGFMILQGSFKAPFRANIAPEAARVIHRFLEWNIAARILLV
jgi:hypothetical protein